MIRRCYYFTSPPSYRMLYQKKAHTDFYWPDCCGLYVHDFYECSPFGKNWPHVRKRRGRFHHYVAGHTLLNDGEGDFMSTIWYSKCLCVQWLHLNYFSRSIMFLVQTGAGCWPIYTPSHKKPPTALCVPIDQRLQVIIGPRFKTHISCLLSQLLPRRHTKTLIVLYTNSDLATHITSR